MGATLAWYDDLSTPYTSARQRCVSDLSPISVAPLNPPSLHKSRFSRSCRAAQRHSGPQVSKWVLKPYITPLERTITRFQRTCSRTATCSRRTTLSSTHAESAVYPMTTRGRTSHSKKCRRHAASGCPRPHRGLLRPPTPWRRVSASSRPPPAPPARPRRAAAAAAR